jgi:hypothetical protein
VGSLIYKGKWHGQPAVLKLQGLKPENEEAEIMSRFARQNKSSLVRVPELYDHDPWHAERGYGFMITEFIDAPRIFELPFATRTQMKEFARFYQEYRTAALTAPWQEQRSDDTVAFTFRRVENWKNISESVGRLQLKEYAPYLMRYYPLAAPHLRSLPLVFCHGHLTANDIYTMSDGSFVVLSNIYWTYRPQWYDLAFNVWSTWQWIRDVTYTFDQLRAYVEEWLDVYRTIPVVRADPDFDRKMYCLLLERVMGGILVDLGANDFYEAPENEKYFRHLLSLHQQLFDYFAEQLQQ